MQSTKWLLAWLSWSSFGLPSMHVFCRIQCIVTSILRHVHIIKIMHIGSELIRIFCVHTECSLTTVCTECSFSQSIAIGGWSQFEDELPHNMKQCGCYIFVCDELCEEMSDKAWNIPSITSLLHLGKLLYLLYYV